MGLDISVHFGRRRPSRSRAIECSACHWRLKHWLGILAQQDIDQKDSRHNCRTNYAEPSQDFHDLVTTCGVEKILNNFCHGESLSICKPKCCLPGLTFSQASGPNG